MKVEVAKLTDYNILNKACGFTMGKESSSPDIRKLFRSEHSPIRTQIYAIACYDIPSFVHVHLVRHKVGIEFFVESLRDDGKGTGDETRNTPVNMLMVANAQALINMARKRLCLKTHEKTRELMYVIRERIADIEPDLAQCMVADCVYRGSCKEYKSCV